MSSRLAWISAFSALLLAQGASALVLLGDDRYVHLAYRSDPYDPSFVDQTDTPDAFFGPFPEQPSSITIAADGLGFDATASGRSSAYFDYSGPYVQFGSRQSSFRIAFRIDGVGRIDLDGTAIGGFFYGGDPRGSLTGPNGTIYSYSFDPYGPSSVPFHAPLPAGEYVLEFYTGANIDGVSGSFDITLAVRDTAVPIVVPFVCANGQDDDQDGLTDFPDDPGCESPGGATEDHVPACSNGVDDDGDTLADAPDDPGCASALDESELGTSRCDNGIDDDGDGFADYPADSDCTSPTEDAELTQSFPLQWKIAVGGTGHYYELVNSGDLSWEAARVEATLRKPPPGYAPGHLVSIASAGEEDFLWTLWGYSGFTQVWIGFTVVNGQWRWIDDTPVSYVNWNNGNPCCGSHAFFPTAIYNGFLGRWSTSNGTNPAYYVEWEPAGLVCDDGVDEDGDGLVDFPEDPGCTSATDPDEEDATLPCDNGIDDDGDGLADFRLANGDPGCPFATARPENPPCDDWIDNDGDGAVDMQDTWCSSAWPYWESPPCGLGAELAWIVVPAGWLGARRRTKNAR